MNSQHLLKIAVVFTVASVFTLLSPLSLLAQPSLAPVVTYASGGRYAESVAVADVNNDGKPDLLVANDYVNTLGISGYVGVLLGNGDGTFQPAVSYDTGGLEAIWVAVADVNGDGKPDLLVANYYDASVGVLLGNGDGTFQKATRFPLNGQPRCVRAADVNGDGKLDLVVVPNFTATVGLLLGNGDGTFQPVVTFGSGGLWPMSVAVADVNGDGRPDFVVANSCSDAQCTDSVVGVLLGNGDGTFQPVVTYGVGQRFTAQSVAVADVNGDGKPDLLVTNSCEVLQCANGSVGVLLGNGDGTFQPAVTYGADQGFSAQSVVVADMNGDGRPDLVLASDYANNRGGNGSVGVLLGNGDGTFQPAVVYGAGGETATSVAVADVNADGKPDVIVANLCAGLGFCNNGSVGVLINTAVFDRTPPTTIAARSVGPNANGWNNTSVTVNLNATDNPGGSGVKQIQFALGGAQNTGWQTVAGNVASVMIATEGTTTLSYLATDKAGNQESAKTLTVRIDKTPPVISGLPSPECTIWPPNHKLVQVATVAASDSLSGIAPGSFTVTGTSKNPADGAIVITGGPGQFNIRLRADKDQVYTLIGSANDLAGNITTTQAICTVPHDQGK